MLSCSYPGAFQSFSARPCPRPQHHKHNPGLLDGGAGHVRLSVLSLCPQSPPLRRAGLFMLCPVSPSHTCLGNHNVIFRISWFRHRSQSYANRELHLLNTAARVP